METKVELILKYDALLGESPIWSVREQVLYWVDILKGQIHRFDPLSKHNTTYHLGQLVACIGPCEGDFLIVALENRIALFNLRNHSLQSICQPEINSPNRFNDGKCDRAGRFWCGTMNQTNPFDPTGNLFRIEKNDSATLMQDRVEEANGMGWSPDNKVFYFTETGRFSIFAYNYDVQTGEISNRRTFATMESNAGGVFDGLTVDSEGCVWSAHNGKGEVVRYTPSGKIDVVIKVPVPKVTSLIFGGKNLDTLFMTTSREKMSKKELDQFPLSGSLFAYKPGILGLPEGLFNSRGSS